MTVRGVDELADVARTFNETAGTLERQVGELRRMESDARRFVADVSHELRTPLAAMTAVTDVLDEEAEHLPGDAGRAARLVSQETQNLTHLVNDLIEVSRFDSGTARLALDDVDVAAAVAATLRIRGWQDRVRMELAPGVVARVDPRRLDVIVANLVGNAFRHGAEPVSVRLDADQDWVTIEVSDHGPGLDPQVLPHVFDRFYKADTARTRSEGSGLGLAISWENARLHRHGERRGVWSRATAARAARCSRFACRATRRTPEGNGERPADEPRAARRRAAADTAGGRMRVRPSAVIVGRPPISGPAQGVWLYLLAPDELVLVLRPAATDPSPADALSLLAAGPQANERGQGLTSDVPAGLDPVTVTSGPARPVASR
ncbi:HAMP domain-containing sensor histidine kinase [Micromonospora sp. M12]